MTLSSSSLMQDILLQKSFLFVYTILFWWTMCGVLCFVFKLSNKVCVLYILSVLTSGVTGVVFGPTRTLCVVLLIYSLALFVVWSFIRVDLYPKQKTERYTCGIYK